MAILSPSSLTGSVVFSKVAPATDNTPPTSTGRSTSVISSVSASAVLVSKVALGACVSIALLKAGCVIMRSVCDHICRVKGNDADNDNDDCGFKRSKNAQWNDTNYTSLMNESPESGTSREHRQLLKVLLRDIGGDGTYSLPDEEEDNYYSDVMDEMTMHFGDAYDTTGDHTKSIAHLSGSAGQAPNSRVREMAHYLLKNKDKRHIEESLLEEFYEGHYGSDESEYDDPDIDFWPEVFDNEQYSANQEFTSILSNVINDDVGRGRGRGKVTGLSDKDSDIWDDMDDEEDEDFSSQDNDEDYSSTSRTNEMSESTSCSDEEDEIGEITRNSRLYFLYSPLSSEHQKARTFCLRLVDRTLLNIASSTNDVVGRKSNAHQLMEDLDSQIRKKKRNLVTGSEIVKGDVEDESNPDCALQIAERLEVYMRHCILYLAQELNIKVFQKGEKAYVPCVDCFIETEGNDGVANKRRISRPKDMDIAIVSNGNESNILMKKLLLSVQEYLEICIEIDRLKPIVVEQSVEEELKTGGVDIWGDNEECYNDKGSKHQRVKKSILSSKNGRRHFMDDAVDDDGGSEISDVENNNDFKGKEMKNEMEFEKDNIQILLSHKRKQELKIAGVMSNDPLQRLLNGLDEKQNLTDDSEEEWDDEDEEWDDVDEETDEEEHQLRTVHDTNRRAFEAAIIRGLLAKLAPQTEIAKYSAALKNSTMAYIEPYDPDASDVESDDGAGGNLLDRYLSGGITREEYVTEKEKRRKQEESKEENISWKRQNIATGSGAAFLSDVDNDREIVGIGGNTKIPYGAAVTHLLANTPANPQPIIPSIDSNMSTDTTNCLLRMEGGSTPSADLHVQMFTEAIGYDINALTAMMNESRRLDEVETSQVQETYFTGESNYISEEMNDIGIPVNTT
eukprot:Tbor_TRINITY_DN5765_c3_g1::TRINITY_DN5765_c3_g1_i1::g.20150::m.20150